MSVSEKADVLLGLQWGDEGKGKIVDVLTPGYNVIARFQGGPNAGHTLEFDGIKHVLHIIPSGIFHPEKINVIGNGVVIDPVIFEKEIIKLRARNVIPENNLLISKKAHLILPTHRLMDAALEAAKGKAKIGSTLKGIGPAYTDKVARNGLRIGDIAQGNFTDSYTKLRNNHLDLVEKYYKPCFGFNIDEFLVDGISFRDYEKLWLKSIDTLRKFTFVDSEILINEYLRSHKTILAEGAQGSLLDVDFGTYPFVTSSNTVCAGVCTGLGIAPSRVGNVYGIFKAYCTRVGNGPFPTELFDETGEMLRKTGNEFGSTTGRPRRCGWLDLPALKYSIMINGVTELIMMKTDVLSDLDTIKICTAYKYQGNNIDYIPYTYDNDSVEPVYTELAGWKKDLTTVTSTDEFPTELNSYIRFIEEYTGVPITFISVGPDRLQTIKR